MDKQVFWDLLTEAGIPLKATYFGRDEYDILRFKDKKKIITYTGSIFRTFPVHDGKVKLDTSMCSEYDEDLTVIIKNATYFIEVCFTRGITRIEIYPGCDPVKLGAELKNLVKCGYNHNPDPFKDFFGGKSQGYLGRSGLISAFTDGKKKQTTITIVSVCEQTVIEEIIREFLKGDYHFDDQKYGEMYAYQRDLSLDSIKLVTTKRMIESKEYSYTIVINRICDPNKTLNFLKENLK